MSSRTLLGGLLLLATVACSSEEPAPTSQPAATATPSSEEGERARAERLAARLMPAFDEVERRFAAGEPLDAGPLLEAAGRAPLISYCGVEEGEELDPARVARVLGGAPELQLAFAERRLSAGVYRAPAPEPSARGKGIALWRVFERQAPGRIAWACLFVPDERVTELGDPR